jgi:hypothetical protein
MKITNGASGLILPVKKCGCGRTYAIDAWLALELAGLRYDFDQATGRFELLEFRHCECGSTITVAWSAEVAP